MDTCLDLIALQYTCMIVMAMLAFFVFVSRYYVTCRNRQFEQSRWMIVVALLLYDKRIAGVHEVTCGLGTSTEWIQSEQSVVVGGYDAFVVNNINVTNQEINDKIIGVIAIGPIVKGPQGAECVRWNTKEKKWESKWTRSDVSSVSMIPAVSIKSEMVFVCGWNDASGWEVTGLDWKSGATRHRSILGKNNRANGAYAIIQYLANGDLLFNSVAGPIRVKY